jgi:XTP/dITP diphosphohydrolase
MSLSCSNSPRLADNSLVIATSNENKFFEIRAALGPLKTPVNFLGDFAEIPEAPETGSTFAENARQKADFYFQHLNRPLLAEDSGLVIPALGGYPGLYSARVAKTDTERIGVILDKMKRVPDRFAYYICSMAFRTAEGIHEAEGICRGTLLMEPDGTQGFGYDPIFKPEDAPRSFGNMTIKEKSNYSHRARAVHQLIPVIQSYLSKERAARAARE